MPRVGFDRFKSAARTSSQLSIDTMQRMRSGQWGQIPPELRATTKTAQLRAAKAQALNSGQYFPNNITEKVARYNQSTMQTFHQKNQMFKDQQ